MTPARTFDGFGGASTWLGYPFPFPSPAANGDFEEIDFGFWLGRAQRTGLDGPRNLVRVAGETPSGGGGTRSEQAR